MEYFNIIGQKFDQLCELANKDFQRWETINKSKGRKQCTNSLNACMVGVFAEEAAAQYVKERMIEAGCHSAKVVSYGMLERMNGESYHNNADIEIVQRSKVAKIEVKGIKAGQPRGQVTGYHLEKYSKEKVRRVVFVEITFTHDSAMCHVYLVDSTENIKNEWMIRPNRYGKDCFTYPAYVPIERHTGIDFNVTDEVLFAGC